MKTKFTFLVLLFASIVGGKLYAQVNPALAQRFQTVLDSVCNKYKIKGTSAAVLIPNVGIWKGVNGVSDNRTPLTTNMLFGMGSNTKTHIAATLLLMQERGLVSLDDTIGKWISGYANIKGNITIRQCLNHTSGLYDYMQTNAINDSLINKPEKIWTKEDILTIVPAPNFKPGASWDYSNTNYIIAGIIMEELMNKSPFAVMDELLLKPHQLNHTYNWGDQPAEEMLANPWSMIMDSEKLTDMTETPYLKSLFSLANTAGSLVTTAEDNVWFWHKLCTKQIINEQSWKEMTKTISIGGQDGYGLGIFRYSRKLNGRTFYSHGGTFFGYINENMFDTTSGTTISVLTNQDSVNNNGLLGIVINALHKVTLATKPVTGVDEVNNNLQALCYPNPANSVLNVSLTESFNGMAQLYDLTGRLMLSIPITSKEISIDTQEIPNGMYMLKLENTTQQSIQRIIVQH